MKKKSTNLTKIATTLCHKIDQEYNKLTFEAGQRFFETYHDIMSCQRDCANDITGEVDHYVEQGHFKLALENIQNLRDTMKYCQAVIELQKQTVNLPKHIRITRVSQNFKRL